MTYQWPPCSHNLLSNGIDTNKDAQCSYSKAIFHFRKNCPQLKKKKEMEKSGNKPHRQTYAPCETCGKKNHPTECCWQNAGAPLRPKRTRPIDKTNDASSNERTSKKANNVETSTSGQSNSKKRDSKY